MYALLALKELSHEIDSDPRSVSSWIARDVRPRTRLRMVVQALGAGLLEQGADDCEIWHGSALMLGPEPFPRIS